MAVEAVIFQQIVDMNWDQAIYTAAPNDTINVAQFAAKGSGTNIAVAITPKGTGYISAQVPDGTAAGGNARGAKCVDLQLSRTASNQVAQGSDNWTLGVSNRTVNNTNNNYLFGQLNSVTNGYSSILVGSSLSANAPKNWMFGENLTANSSNNCLVGEGNVVTNAFYSTVIGRFSRGTLGNNQFIFGERANGYLSFSHVRATTRFSVDGDCQKQRVFGRVVTTNDTPSEILWPTSRLVIPSGRLWSGKLTISAGKSDGSKVAIYERNVSLKRVNSATSIVALEAIGTDVTEGTAIAVIADDANEALSVFVTGVTAETWRWMVVFEFNDLLFGT